MLSMVNANRFVSRGAIPLVLIAYAVYIWFDHAHATLYERDPDIKVLLENVKNNRSVDALVFGGSNAVYGLSAEYLSYHLRLNWYNASVDGELGSVNEYEHFVRELSARIDRTKVKYVVYSSLVPYLIGAIDDAEKRVSGEGIRPSGSVLGRVVRYISQHLRSISHRSQDNRLLANIVEGQRNSFGDIVFESVKCAFTKTPEHQRVEEDVSAAFLVDQAMFFSSVFPNASILIVLPSEYYGVASFDDSIFEQNLRTNHDLLHEKYHFEGMVKIIFQPPYLSITQVCDDQSHANEVGRAWRTGNLIESIHEIR